MLASLIFHHSRHIRLSLSSLLPPSSSLSHTYIYAFGVFAVLSLSWFSLFRHYPLVFVRAASLFRTTVAANSTLPHFTPTQCQNVSLLAHPHSIASLPSSSPSPLIFLAPSQSRTRNLIQNVPNTIHIIILVADNGKFV